MKNFINEMINILAKKSCLITSFIFALFMFVIVMFVINPMIDGGNGFGLIQLQLSFDKTEGIKILESWGGYSVQRFKQWIYTDYIYAFSYALFLASVLSTFIIKTGAENSMARYLPFIPMVAGLLDWLEDSMELQFMNDLEGYSEVLFTIHSWVACTKFAFISVGLIFIIKLLIKSQKRYKNV